MKNTNQLSDAATRISPYRTHDKARLLTAADLLSLDQPSKTFRQPVAIHQLLVEGLLSFGEPVSLRFGRLNILVGPNGSGKSNLIDCIRVLRFAPLDIQEAFKDSGFEDWLFKGNKSGIAALEAVLELEGHENPIRHELRLGPPRSSRALLEERITDVRAKDGEVTQYFVGSHRGGAMLTAAGTGRRRRERPLGSKQYNPFASILSQIRDIGQYPEITQLSGLYASFRIYSEWSFGRNSVLREASPTGRSETSLSESMSDLPLALNALEKTAAHEKIRTLLHELKETYKDYKTLILFGRVGLELLEAPFDQPLPAKRLSDGTLRFLALAAILLNPDPAPVICLEEPELGMHPDMIRLVAQIIADSSTKAQLFITTHSEHLLTALQDDFDTLFAFGAAPGGSFVRPFSRDEYKHWREDHNLGELWTVGELGGNRW